METPPPEEERVAAPCRTSAVGQVPRARASRSLWSRVMPYGRRVPDRAVGMPGNGSSPPERGKMRGSVHSIGSRRRPAPSFCSRCQLRSRSRRRSRAADVLRGWCWGWRGISRRGRRGRCSGGSAVCPLGVEREWPPKTSPVTGELNEIVRDLGNACRQGCHECCEVAPYVVDVAEASIGSALLRLNAIEDRPARKALRPVSEAGSPRSECGLRQEDRTGSAPAFARRGRIRATVSWRSGKPSRRRRTWRSQCR